MYIHRFRKGMAKIDTWQSGLPVLLFTFCSKLGEFVTTMVCTICVVRLHLLRLSEPVWPSGKALGW